MGIARGWEKQVIRTNNGQSVFLAFLPVSLQTFCLIVRKNLITQKYGLFCNLYTPYGRVRLAARAWDSDATLNRFWEKTDCFALYKGSV